jgi:hypothetical protein
MPMIHTHSFLALGLISAGMFFAFLIRKETLPNRKQYIINWIIYGVIVAIIAFPQLFYWTFSQTSGNSAFVRFKFNWVNSLDPFIWFYIKNWGIFAIFLIPAFLNSDKEKKRLFLACLPLVLIAELFVFQPNEYDNNKLIYISYFIFIILESDYFVYLWNKLKGAHGTKVFYAVAIIFLGTISGVLTIAREWVSGKTFLTFSEDTIEVAKYVKENTPKDAIILTGTQHINPISDLAGRSIYVGPSVFVYFHGFQDEFSQREADVRYVYSADYDYLKRFCEKNNISYIYVSSYERNDFNVNEDSLNKFDLIFESGECKLYKVK